MKRQRTQEEAADELWEIFGFSKEGAEALELECHSKHDFFCLRTSPRLSRMPDSLLQAAIRMQLGRVVDAELRRDPELDPYKIDPSDVGRLQVAAVCGHLDVVKDAFQKTAWPPKDSHKWRSVCFWAASGGRLPIVQYAIRKGQVDPNAVGIWRSMAAYAARHDHLDVLVWLMQHTNARWTEEDSEIKYARGRCLLWILQQPGAPVDTPGCCKIMADIVGRLKERAMHGSLLDLRNRGLGDNACKLVRWCLLHECSQLGYDVDVSENPRIGDNGFMRLLVSLQHNPKVREHQPKLIMSDMPIRSINSYHKRFRELGRWYKGMFVPDVQLVCAFPSLVTIVSCWIADQIRYDIDTEKPNIFDMSEGDDDDDDDDDDVELTQEETKDLDDHARRLESLKERYAATHRQELEADASLKGCWIVFYKDKVWCKGARCASFAAALDVFQKEVNNRIEDAFYVTRIGYEDSPPT